MRPPQILAPEEHPITDANPRPKPLIASGFLTANKQLSSKKPLIMSGFPGRYGARDISSKSGNLLRLSVDENP
jgi:hypothetical protein